jgi:hypothetical protein
MILFWLSTCSHVGDNQVTEVSGLLEDDGINAVKVSRLKYLRVWIDGDWIREYWSILLIPLLDRRDIGGGEE